MAREPREEKRSERKRRGGHPVGMPSMRMHVEPREGYFRYWFNDTPGNIQSALDGDYEFVKEGTVAGTLSQQEDLAASDAGGQRVSKVVGTQADGSPMVAYLMEIPQEWYDEDQAKILASAREVEHQIKTGKVPGDEAEDTEHRYGEVKVVSGIVGGRGS